MDPDIPYTRGFGRADARAVARGDARARAASPRRKDTPWYAIDARLDRLREETRARETSRSSRRGFDAREAQTRGADAHKRASPDTHPDLSDPRLHRHRRLRTSAPTRAKASSSSASRISLRLLTTRSWCVRASASASARSTRARARSRGKALSGRDGGDGGATRGRATRLDRVEDAKRVRANVSSRMTSTR